MASGIRIPVKIILIILQSFVFPRPDSAPMVISSTLIKGFPKSDDGQVTNGNQHYILFMEKQGGNRAGDQYKGCSDQKPPGNQQPKGKCCILSGYGPSFLHHNSVLGKHLEAAPKPSAVFQDRDSICPPTRWTAIAPAPKPETIRVRIMEIRQ